MTDMLSRRTVLQSASLAGLAATLGAPASAQIQHTPWLIMAPMPEASAEVLGVALHGKLHVFCGLAPGFRPRGLVLQFDPGSNSWAEKQPMPRALHHVAFAALGDKIYGFGGFALPSAGPPSWMPVGDCWEYDPAADRWRALAPMPTVRGAAAAVELDGKLYVIGGASLPTDQKMLLPGSPQMVVGTVEVYDPVHDQWERRSNMPTPRNHHAVGAIGRKIYAIGGRIGSVFIPFSNPLDLVESYDPATDRWGPVLERMPTPRSGCAWASDGRQVYVAGGEAQDRAMLSAYRAVEAYDPARNRWTVLPSMPTPRHGCAGAIIDNKFYIAGGEAQSGGSGTRGETPFNHALQLDKI